MNLRGTPRNSFPKQEMIFPNKFLFAIEIIGIYYLEFAASIITLFSLLRGSALSFAFQCARFSILYLEAGPHRLDACR